MTAHEVAGTGYDHGRGVWFARCTCGTEFVGRDCQERLDEHFEQWCILCGSPLGSDDRMMRCAACYGSLVMPL